jgi:hypothetical protein
MATVLAKLHALISAIINEAGGSGILVAGLTNPFFPHNGQPSNNGEYIKMVAAMDVLQLCNRAEGRGR